MPPLVVEFVSLSPVEVLGSNPTGPQSHIVWGLFLPFPDTPKLGSLMWDSGISLLWYNFCGILFSSLCVTHLARIGFNFTMIAPLLPSCCGFFFSLDAGDPFLVGSIVWGGVSRWLNLPANAGTTGDGDLIPRLGRSPGGGNVHPLQYSCWENPMDRGAFQATFCKVTKSLT